MYLPPAVGTAVLLLYYLIVHYSFDVLDVLELYCGIQAQKYPRYVCSMILKRAVDPRCVAVH